MLLGSWKLSSCYKHFFKKIECWKKKEYGCWLWTMLTTAMVLPLFIPLYKLRKWSWFSKASSKFLLHRFSRQQLQKGRVVDNRMKMMSGDIGSTGSGHTDGATLLPPPCHCRDLRFMDLLYSPIPKHPNCISAPIKMAI